MQELENLLPTILLVDDDIELLASAELLLRNQYKVLTSSAVLKAKHVMRHNAVDVAIVDLSFEGQELDGIDLIDWISKNYPDVATIVLSADKDTSRVVRAIRKSGLVEFIPKDINYINDLHLAIKKGLEIRKKNDLSELDSFFPTQSEVVKAELRKVKKIFQSGQECSILITGETGTGKEFLARYIAACFKKNIVCANMGAIPSTLAESELFGYTKGSFTGAVANKVGLVAQAHQGIFFLDEIGECTLDIQVKLLRVIQEREVMAVGATSPTKLSIQFIAATNKNLEEMTSSGEFRLDLLNRINTVVLHIPALRERTEDIGYYFNYFLNNETDESQSYSLKASGLDALVAHPWTGNLRELQSFVKRLVIFGDSKIIDDVLVRKILLLDKGQPIPFEAKVDDLKINILKMLEETNGNRDEAARRLQIGRSTIYRYLRKFGQDTATNTQKEARS